MIHLLGFRGICIKARKSKNKELFLYIKLLGLIHNLKAGENLKKLHAGLIDNGFIPEDDPLLDLTIFKKIPNPGKDSLTYLLQLAPFLWHKLDKNYPTFVSAASTIFPLQCVKKGATL